MNPITMPSADVPLSHALSHTRLRTARPRVRRGLKSALYTMDGMQMCVTLTRLATRISGIPSA